MYVRRASPLHAARATAAERRPSDTEQRAGGGARRVQRAGAADVHQRTGALNGLPWSVTSA